MRVRVGYVFQSRFSAGMISPISMIFGILNKEYEVSLINRNSLILPRIRHKVVLLVL